MKKCHNYWCHVLVGKNKKYCDEQCKRFAKLYRDEYGIDSSINNGKAILGNGFVKVGSDDNEQNHTQQ